MTLANIKDMFKHVKYSIQVCSLHIRTMFGVILVPKNNFQELYEKRMDCFGHKLPEFSIDSEMEDLMEVDAVVYAYNSANLHLDEKVRNGKEIKEKGYKLLGVLTTITLAVFGLVGYVYLNDEFSYPLKCISIIFLFGGIFWLFCIISYLTEHLLKSVDYWHSGQLPENFINKQLLTWCAQKEKNQSKHFLCYEINRIQDKIHFNEAENKRRLIVVDVTLNHLTWFVLFLIACILFFMLFTI